MHVWARRYYPISSTGAKPNRSALHSVCIGAPPGLEINRLCNTIFSDPGPRCTYPFEKYGLAHQVATIVAAGHETTSAALFWSLYLMASAPEEQEAVAAEVGPLDVGPDGAVYALPKLIHT